MGQGSGWSECGSQENLIAEKDLRERVKREKRQTDRKGGQKLLDVPSGWTKLSHCRVENQSVTDWAREEILVWLGGNGDGLHAVYLDPASPKLKSA